MQDASGGRMVRGWQPSWDIPKAAERSEESEVLAPWASFHSWNGLNDDGR